jgi:hypothetical protein
MAKTTVSKKNILNIKDPALVISLLAFALAGAALLQVSDAARSPKFPENQGSCAFVTNPMKVGDKYLATAANLPGDPEMNLLWAYGDGTKQGWVYSEDSNGQIYNYGTPNAKVSGVTTLRITGREAANDKNTRVYATCTVQVNP